MKDYFCGYVATMNGKDLFVKLGFCPERVRITALDDGAENYWVRMLGTDGAIVRATTGDRTITTDKGIKLVKFTEEPINTTSDPAEVDPGNYIDANGIQITADVVFLGDDEIVFVEAWRMTNVMVKATHDGTTSMNYLEDASYDFKDLGVSGNLTWLCYNLTNGNYAYIKEVIKPSGTNKYSRLTLCNASGTAYTTAEADIDTGDVCYIFPLASAWYPMSDVGLMA